MSVLAGPLMAIALLMGWAGVLKLARPAATTGALRAARLPGGDLAVRALGFTEVAIAAVTLAVGGPWAAAAVAVYYAGFAVFTSLLISRSGSQAPCGCFGEASTGAPANRLHVVMNLVAAALAAAAVAWPPGGLPDIVVDQPLAGVPFLLLVGVTTALWYATITLVPDLYEAIGELSADEAGAG